MKVRLNLTDIQWDLLISTLENGTKQCENIVKAIKKSLQNTKESRKYSSKVKRIVTEKELAEIKIRGLNKVRAIAEQYRTKLVLNATPYEKKTKAILKSLNIEYDFQKVFLNTETFYIVDFYLPEYNIVLEIDGGQHLDKDIKTKDEQRSKVLKDFNSIKYIARIPNVDTLNTIYYRNRIKSIIEHVKTLK